jgi:hypothetical protein
MLKKNKKKKNCLFVCCKNDITWNSPNGEGSGKSEPVHKER